jgi:hypothetical protein
MRNALAVKLAMYPAQSEAVTNPGKDTSECTGKTRSTEEQSDTIMLLVSFIPHRQIVYHTGEKTALGNT